jgi:hypothetical protein
MTMLPNVTGFENPDIRVPHTIALPSLSVAIHCARSHCVDTVWS